jgi:hypothetical protein
LGFDYWEKMNPIVNLENMPAIYHFGQKYYEMERILQQGFRWVFKENTKALHLTNIADSR